MGVGGHLREAYQREKERTPAALDLGTGLGECYDRSHGRVKWVGGQHQGELAAIWAVGEISGKNGGIQYPGKIDRSKAGSWLWRNWVLAKFSRQKTEEAQEGCLVRTWIQTKPKN